MSYPDGDATADGSADLLAPYIEGEEWYVKFAHEYFEVHIPLTAVQTVYASEPLTHAIIHALAPEADAALVIEEAVKIGYPVAGW